MRIALIAAILLAACSPASPESGPNEPTGRPSETTPSFTVGAPAPSIASSTAGVAPSTLAQNRTCPVTEPNGETPPGEPADPNYLGNGRLWTVLWPKGLVLIPKGNIGPDGSLGMKFPWWRASSVHGVLSIRGHELGSGLPVEAGIPEGYGDTGFQPSGIAFPLEGCYAITGEAGAAELTFVTLVRSCSALAELSPAERARYSICDA